MGSHSAVVKRERAMGILVFLLLFLLFEDNVSCQRLRCGPSQKMNAYGRCVKAWSSTISMAQSEINVVETLASELRSRLGNNILIPCKDVDNLQPVNMAGQSCFVDDCWSNEGCDCGTPFAMQR